MSDTRVLLITPRFDEVADDAAASARTLAHAYADAGAKVFVLCPATMPRPAVEIRPGIEIRRIDVPRREVGAFATRAIAAALEIERRHSLRAIECVQAAELTIACKFAAAAGLLAAPIVHVRVAAAVDARDECADAIADAVHTLASAFTRREDAESVSLPMGEARWGAPAAKGPVFAIPTLIAESRHAEIVEAVDEAAVGQSSWTLAAATAGGRWIVADGERGSSVDGGECVVIVGSDSSVFPAVGLQAIGSGFLALIDAASPLADRVPAELGRLLVYRGRGGLVAALRRVAGVSAAQRRDWMQQLRAGVAGVSHAELLAKKRASWAAIRPGFDSAAARQAWRLAEGGGSLVSPVLQEAST